MLSKIRKMPLGLVIVWSLLVFSTPLAGQGKGGVQVSKRPHRRKGFACSAFHGGFKISVSPFQDPHVSARFVGLLNFIQKVDVNSAGNLTVAGNQPQTPAANGKCTQTPFGHSCDAVTTGTIAGFQNVSIHYVLDILLGTPGQRPNGPATLTGQLRYGENGALPGEYPGGEVFYTLSGTATFDTFVDDCNNAGSVGEPVSTATGELYDTYPPDLVLGGPMPFAFQRRHGSLLQANGVSSALGVNWMHNFDLKLVLVGNEAIVIRFGGSSIAFSKTGSGWSLEAAQPLGFQLVNSGSNFQFLDPGDDSIYTFSSTGALLKIEDRLGNALTITPSSDGPTQVSDGLGRTLTFSYTAGKLAKVQDQSGRSVAFSYSGNNLAGSTDANGKTTTFSYTQAGSGGILLSGLMTSAKLPAGNTPFTNRFDALGRASQQVDSRGNITKIAYETPQAGFTTVTDALGNTTVHGQKNLTSLDTLGDAASQTAGLTYDANSRLTSVTDRLGDKTLYTYHDPSGYLASSTDALGNVTKHTYTPQTQGSFTFYVLTAIAYPDGATESFTYDKLGNLSAMVDAAGKSWQYTYNGRGQVLTAANPSGGVTTYTYNADGTVASRQSPSGDTDSYAYDSQKRLSKIVYADGATQSFAYDSRDNIVGQTDERSKSHKHTYDDNNNPKSEVDAHGQARQLTFDTDDRLSAAIDRLGNRSTYAYDVAGRLKTITNAAGETTNYAYDSLNRLASSIDAAGKGNRYAYDKEGVLTSMTNALSQTWNFSSDKMGRIVRTTTPLGEVFSRTYDKRGRLTALTNPMNQSTNLSYDGRGLLSGTSISGGTSGAPAGNEQGFSYDGRGLISGASIAGGISVALARNELGEISSVTDPNGGQWSSAYDATGRITSRTDPLSRVTSYAYDARQRLSSLTTPEGNASFTYDAHGNLLRRLYSDNTDLNFTYDDNNRLLTGPGVVFGYDANGRINSSNGLGITRNGVGRITAITYGSGKTVQYQYNNRGLLVSITDWVGGSTTLAYDDARRLISINRPNGTSTQFSYDQNGRLSGIVESTGSTIALKRDGAGRVISADRNLPQAAMPAPGTLPLGYDAAHQVKGYIYDGDGRLLNDGLRMYTWDQPSRLNGYSGADGSASATYDGLGLRVSSTSGGSTLNYVLNYALELPSISTVQDGSGNDLHYYVHLPGGILLYSIEAADNTRRFYQYDYMGSTTALTDDSGAITDVFGIPEYGETVTPGPNNVTSTPFTWLGAFGVMQEGTTGLYYMRYRYYDSSTARFLSPDPIRSLEPRSVNPYQYALGNPVDFSDPSGLSPTGPVFDFVAKQEGQPQEAVYRESYPTTGRGHTDVVYYNDGTSVKELYDEDGRLILRNSGENIDNIVYGFAGVDQSVLVEFSGTATDFTRTYEVFGESYTQFLSRLLHLSLAGVDVDDFSCNFSEGSRKFVKERHLVEPEPLPLPSDQLFQPLSFDDPPRETVKKKGVDAAYDGYLRRK